MTVPSLGICLPYTILTKLSNRDSAIWHTVMYSVMHEGQKKILSQKSPQHWNHISIHYVLAKDHTFTFRFNLRLQNVESKNNCISSANIFPPAMSGYFKGIIFFPLQNINTRSNYHVGLGEREKQAS